MKIFYLGPKGSYSYWLLQKARQKDVLLPLPTFVHVADAVMRDEDSIGLLGIENSISSSVHESVDIIFHNDLYIVGEACMDIQLHLIGTKKSSLSDIQEVFSYPQAIAQCSSFIKKHDLKTHETPSTAAAVHEIDTLQDDTKAAIAGRGSLPDTDLQILRENIANTSHNMTRWVFVSKKPFSIDEPTDKMTVIFKVRHEPGSLVRVLNAIASERGNMSKIESRPVPGSNWEYLFWIDIEIPPRKEKVFKELLEREALSYRIVGVYKKGKTYTE